MRRRRRADRVRRAAGNGQDDAGAAGRATEARGIPPHRQHRAGHQGIRDAGGRGGASGYLVAYALAEANLALGQDVVADSVNPLGVTRNAWRRAAANASSPCVEIEVVCSDPVEHRRRVEARQADIAGFRVPSWDDVQQHAYEPWDRPRLVLDTAGRGVADLLAELHDRMADASAGP